MKFSQATVTLLLALKAKCEKILQDYQARLPAGIDNFTTRQITAAIAVITLLLKHKDDLGAVYPLSEPRPEIERFQEYMQQIDGNQLTWVPPVGNATSAAFAQAYIDFLTGFIPLVETKKDIDTSLFEKALILGIEKLVGYKRAALKPMFEQLQRNIAAELGAFRSIELSNPPSDPLQMLPLYSLQLYAAGGDQQQYTPPTTATIQLTKGVGRTVINSILDEELKLAQSHQLPAGRFKHTFLKLYSRNDYDDLVAAFKTAQMAFSAFVATYDNKAWKKALLDQINAELLINLNSILTAGECETLFGERYTRAYTAIEYIKGSSLENTVNAAAMQEKLQELQRYADSVEQLFQQKQRNRGNVATQLDNAKAFKTKIDTAIKDTIHKNLALIQPMLNRLLLSLKTLAFSQLLTNVYKTLQTNINEFTKGIAEASDSVGTTGEELNVLKAAVIQLILKSTVATEPLLMFDVAEHERTLAYSLLKSVLKTIKFYVESRDKEVGCKAIKVLFDKNSNFESKQDTVCENLFYWIRAMAQNSRSQQSAPATVTTHKTQDPNVAKFYAMLAGTIFEYNALKLLQVLLKPSPSASLTAKPGE